MHPKLRPALLISIFFVLLLVGLLTVITINPQLLRTQSNLQQGQYAGTITLSRQHFIGKYNTINAAVLFKDRSTQNFSTTVEIEGGDPRQGSPLPQSSPITTAGPNRTADQALASLGPSCGNGLIEEGEECDLGDNAAGLLGCSQACKLTSKQCEFYGIQAPVQPGNLTNFSSGCFTEGNFPVSIVSINNKPGLASRLEEIDPSKQSGPVPGAFRRAIPWDIEGGGRRGFYIVRGSSVIGATPLYIHPSLTLPETRLSGLDEWDLTLATPGFIYNNTDLPETILVQTPSQIPNNLRSGNNLTFYLSIANSCATNTTPDSNGRAAGINNATFNNTQENLRLTKFHLANQAGSGSQLCLYLEDQSQSTFELQAQAPLYESN